jgi:branched-chain amino acid transport system substrate-binding protein
MRRIMAAAALTATAAAASAAEPIRIGAFLAVTGPAAFLGEPEKKTLELYVQRLNAAGGVLGRPLRLVVHDTGGEVEDAVASARHLIERERVDAIIGGTTTGETMAAIPLVERARLPFISLGGASMIVEPVRPWVFKAAHSDRMAVAKIYADMQRRAIDAIGLIAGSGAFDRSCLAEAQAQAPKVGITIKAVEQYDQADIDPMPQLARLRAAGVQAVLFCGFGSRAMVVTRSFAQLGMDMPLYHTHASCSKRFITGSGHAAEGVRLPCAALLVADQLPDDDPQRRTALAYAETYRAAYREDVSTFGGHAYDALHLLVHAIETAGTTEPAKVRDALESTQGFVGVDGIFNLTPEDHMGLGPESFKMVEVWGGTWKYLP